MSEKEKNAALKQTAAPEGKPAAPAKKVKKAKKEKKPKKKGSGLLGRIIRRFFLVLFTVVILLVGALALVMNLVFNGPSEAARKVLTMSLLEPSATKWIPGLFMDEEVVESIRNASGAELEEEVTDTSLVVISRSNNLSTDNDEWADYPDGIRIEEYSGKTFNAHIMLVQDPSRVYMGMSTTSYSPSIPGKRLTEAVDETGAAAGINAGAFYDDGTANSIVGSVPAGLVVSGSQVVWDAYDGLVPEEGFAGFNEDNILVVAKSMTANEAMEQHIRDGCEFGPVLIINGEVNQEVYTGNSGYNPRTCVGQRSDGVVVFLCIDGRQAGSLGGTYKDCIDILLEYGCVNACNMDGGSSSVMLYRDTYGLYGEADTVTMVNSYSVMQSQPRRMPNYWLVKPLE